MSSRIMIVETERITAADIEETLLEMGCSISAVVSTGPEALTKAQEARPDLVLMDIGARGALEAVKAARLLRESFCIPVVFLISAADDDTLTLLGTAQPLGYLAKPFLDSDLRATVQLALGEATADLLEETAFQLQSIASSSGSLSG